VHKVPIFQDCEPSFTARLVGLLQPRLYAPRDTIILEGELGKEMYFIVRGSVEISVEGKIVNVLGPMQFFGELALLFNTPRTATIRAISFCDVFVLERYHLCHTQRLLR
jgi:CRP-like cAMP-binding protein